MSRLYVAINLAALSVSSVCANTTGGGVEYSKRGSAYRRSATTGVTNRLTVVETHFLVTGSDNGTYLFDFTYEETTASAPNAFQGDRAIGFRCSNEGAFGKEAEIWLEGSLGGG